MEGEEYLLHKVQISGSGKFWYVEVDISLQDSRQYVQHSLAFEAGGGNFIVNLLATVTPIMEFTFTF
jgi:hypothetical protein